MALYKRGNTWWFKFRFQGQAIRESAKTASKTLAREAERARRRELEMGVNQIKKRERMPLFKLAAEQWLASKVALTPLGRGYYTQYVNKLTRHFGGRLVSDITLDDIAALQRKRQAEGLSARTVNCEVATLRQVLKHFGLWLPLAGRVRFLRERTDTGRALSTEDERKLLDAIGQSRSPALYPMFVLSLDAGLRPSEIRSLRRRDLRLNFQGGVIADGEVIVGLSKTEAGTGRIVPLTRRACAALTLWLARFPDAGPDSYLFPFHHVGFSGNGRTPHLWGVDFEPAHDALQTRLGDRPPQGGSEPQALRRAPYLRDPLGREPRRKRGDDPPARGPRQHEDALPLLAYPGAGEASRHRHA